MRTVKEISDLTGISVRTLHYLSLIHILPDHFKVFLRYVPDQTPDEI